MGEKVLENLKEVGKNIKKNNKKFKFKALDWETTEKAKLLYKNMLSTSNGYINKYSAEEMFK